MEVLVEGSTRRDPGQLRGRTRHNKAVNFEGTAPVGELVEVEIESATSQTLTGTSACSAACPSRSPCESWRSSARPRWARLGVAIEVAERLRERGEDPVAVSCDAMQVSPRVRDPLRAASADERARLEHRLLGIAELDEESRRDASPSSPTPRSTNCSRRAGGRSWSVGRPLHARRAQPRLRPPVPSAVRAAVEAEVAPVGPQALHAELLDELRSGVHPNDRKRIVRLTELSRLGIAAHPGSKLWSEGMRVPTLLVGLTADRDELRVRIEARGDEMVRLGAVGEVRSAEQAGARRTARAAIGFDELLRDDARR